MSHDESLSQSAGKSQRTVLRLPASDPRLPSLPIRWRLTLWYAAILALVMALFSGALYLTLRQQLYASFDEHLLNQAALTLAAVHVRDGQPSLPETGAGVPDAEYFLRLLDREGQVLAATESEPPALSLDTVAVAGALAGRTAFSDGRDEDQEIVRIVSVPVRAGPNDPTVVGALQLGLDRNEIDEPLAQLLTALAIAGPFVLLLAAAIGYLLAGRALAPVTAITNLAAGIDASDLHARLNLDLPDDELGRLARTFDAMLARIDDAFTRQRRFTGDAAHELRTPLSLMRSQVDLALARPRANDEYREALRALDGDLARMTHLVGTLLTLARADAGRLAPEFAPCDLAETVAATLEQYVPLAAASGVTVRSETSPVTLVADQDLLVQLMVNLLDNALAHSPAGGTIAVGSRSEARQAHVWVADSGTGIAPEHQQRVFDRFYRVDEARGRRHGGVGLGLAICKAIVEAHGGTIALTSEVGRGTRVDVVVPATPRPHSEFILDS